MFFRAVGEKREKLMLHRYCVSNLWSHDILCIVLSTSDPIKPPWSRLDLIIHLHFCERFFFLLPRATQELRKWFFHLGTFWSSLSAAESRVRMWPVQDALIFSGCVKDFCVFYFSLKKKRNSCTRCKKVNLFHSHCFLQWRCCLFFAFILVCDFFSAYLQHTFNCWNPLDKCFR